MPLGKNALMNLTSSQYFLLIEKLEENGRNIKKNTDKRLKIAQYERMDELIFAMSTELS